MVVTGSAEVVVYKPGEAVRDVQCLGLVAVIAVTHGQLTHC